MKLCKFIMNPEEIIYLAKNLSKSDVKLEFIPTQNSNISSEAINSRIQIKTIYFKTIANLLLELWKTYQKQKEIMYFCQYNVINKIYRNLKCKPYRKMIKNTF